MKEYSKEEILMQELIRSLNGYTKKLEGYSRGTTYFTIGIIVFCGLIITYIVLDFLGWI